MIRRMIKEEWRTHSTLYRGASFATFPLVVAAFSLVFSWLTLTYSSLGPDALGTAITALGGFLGLMVGSIGFSSKDAMENVLGPMNLLIYSSRTLPISERRLVFDFLVKDVIYYTGLFLVPIAVGPLVFAGTALLADVAAMFGLFSAGLLLSLVVSRTTVTLPSTSLLSYRRLSFLSPLSKKSVLDLSRSSGGLIKILFSAGLLTGFYWFAVLNFPATRGLLSNPLLSFSVVIGTINLSIYNWINRYDTINEYSYLPVEENNLLDAKKEAYLFIAVPLTLFVVLASYVLYPQNLVVSIISAVSTTVFTLAVAAGLTGLEPNEKLFNSWIFLKFTLANSLVVVPLLIFTIIYRPEMFWIYTGLCGAVALASSVSLVFRNQKTGWKVVET
ncbi:hypothetical protein [Candidatus Nanohalococcus occultus]|uniref:hypothetical protein n=1 Tax=Candidatus Nanohalococcus occultus TaxID=2978047 RepID=UPI0039DFE80A